MDVSDYYGMFVKKHRENIKKMGYANIIIAGKTGVGKSTLINEAFRENLAETGIGNPVTKGIQLMQKEDFPLKIYDTIGLELDEKSKQKSIGEMIGLIKNNNKSSDEKNAIHLMWYCIASPSRRIESAEEEFIHEVSKQIPVVIVLTQSYIKSEAAELKRFIENKNLGIKNVLMLLAKDQPITEKLTVSAFGVEDLIEYSLQLFPEQARDAFINAQKASLKLKRDKANIIITATASIAFGAGFIPLPFADAAALVPTQIGMLAGISTAYGINITRNTLNAFITSLVGPGMATLAGRAMVANLFKLVPGAGTALGGVISGSTAMIITVALGKTYMFVVEAIVKGEISEATLNSEKFKKKVLGLFKQNIKMASKEKSKKAN